MKTTVVALILVGTSSILGAQDESEPKFRQALDRATKTAAQIQRFELRYQFTPGQEFRWKVEDVSTNKTTAANLSEIMSSRSQSTAIWKVLGVDSLGRATLEQTIERVSMWQKNGEQAPISYESGQNSKPPMEFESIAAKVGKPLSTILVDPLGSLVAGGDEANHYSFGTGSPWIPLPSEPVGIDHIWYSVDEVAARNEDKSIKRIKLRLRYQLVEVKDEKARITFQTEILTPIDDPKIRSQISQRVVHGEVQLDLPRGLTLGKTVHWNDKVQGFQGPESLLHYLREYSASYLDAAPKAAVQAVPVARTKPLKIRTRDDGPVFRR